MSIKAVPTETPCPSMPPTTHGQGGGGKGGNAPPLRVKNKSPHL